MVTRLSLAKARKAAQNADTRFVLGSDTTVSLLDRGRWRVFGKPVDSEDARAMLRALEGREHRVHTGFALLDRETGVAQCGFHESRVTLRRLDDVTLGEYLASGIGDDKAGAYGVQDQRFRLVTDIRGCVASVMGLPVGLVREALLKVGLPVADTQTMAAACAALTGMPCCLSAARDGGV